MKDWRGWMDRGSIVCLTFETLVKAKGMREEDWSGKEDNIDCRMTRG